MNLQEIERKCTGVSIATINLGNEYSLTNEVKWLIEQAKKAERLEAAINETLQSMSDYDRFKYEEKLLKSLEVR